MKLMVLGGKRSREFAEQVQSMFAVVANVLPGMSLDDVERMVVLGNLVERVLVLESAWTLDGVSTNERDVRKRIGQMTHQARERGGYEQYVFMARSEASARLCFEETYDICDRAAIVLYEQQATVVILHELLSKDILAMRPALVYRPTITAIEEPYSVRLDVAQDTIEDTEIKATTKRVIKKTRGAAIQRLRGDTPWYAVHRTGGNIMRDSLANSVDYFAPTSLDNGFADNAAVVRVQSVDLSGQLSNIFNGSPNAFTPVVTQPAAIIPVAPVSPGFNDMAAFIRAKGHRGYVLTFIGPGGSGSTFMALNCAARIYAAGFSTAFVDGDLTGHSAQYLTSLGITGDVLSAEIEARTLRPGFDMFSANQFKATDGRAWRLPAEAVSRYDFTIVDLPFAAISQGAQALSVASRVAVTVESSNWGIGKAALALFNTPVEVAPVIRERARLIYNRSDKLSSGLFGAPVADDASIKRKVDEVFGARGGAFTLLPAAAIVGSYASVEDCWFTERLFSDGAEGAALFDSVVRGLLA
ncbi:hypothetical protein FACS1894208_00470 [Clostridia bacterium]|nr:hypothetical protein FACS1894208_00470 [Clostridia bacterium]